MDEKKDSSFLGSLLKASVIATPFAIGASSAFQDILSEDVTKAVNPSIKGAVEALGDIQRQYSPSIDPSIYTSSLLKRHSFLSTKGGAEAAKQAWYHALRSTDPLTKKSLEQFTTRLSSADPNEVTSVLSNMMKTNKSIRAGRVYRTFHSNLSAIEQSGLSPIAKVLATDLPKPLKGQFGGKLSKAVNEIETTLGTTVSSQFFSRPGYSEYGLGTYALNFQTKLGNLELMVPTTRGGVLVAGKNQQTKYIAPGVLIFDPATRGYEKLSRSEFVLREFQESILPDIQSGRIRTIKQAKAAIGELNKNVIYSLQNVPNIPTHLQGAAQQEYEWTRGQAINLMVKQQRNLGKGSWRYASAFRTPTEEEIADAVVKKNLFGGVSPKAIAKGRLQQYDLSQRYLAPWSIDWGRRPESLFREWGLTQGAAQQLGGIEGGRFTRYRRYEPQASLARQASIVNPHLSTVYLDPKKHATLISNMEMGEGEGILSRQVSSMMKFERGQTVHLTHANENLLAAIQSGGPLDIEAGKILGYDAEGKAIRMTPEMRLLGGTTHFTAGRGEYLTLKYMEEKRVRSSDKWFSGFKSLMRHMDGVQLKSKIQRNNNMNLFINNIDAVMNIETLTKDKGLHTRQMISALGEALEFKHLAGARLSSAAEAFRVNPEAAVNAMQASLIGEGQVGQGMYSHQAFTQRLMEFAVKEGRLTSREFGPVFGAVPAAFSEDVYGNMKAQIPGTHVAAMEQGIATGISQVAYGGSGYSGRMGSVEPRIYDILKGPAFSEMGESVTGDITRQLAFTNPEKFFAHDELGKSILSFAGKATPSEGGATWDIAKQGYSASGFQNFIESGGGWVDPGKGISPIYVPSATTMSAMAPYQAGSSVIKGDLSKTYHNLAYELNLLNKNQITQEEASREMEMTARQLFEQWAPGGKGAGSVLRGKIMGSRRLTGVSQIGNYTSANLRAAEENVMVAGIPRNMAEEMFDELSTIYGKEAIGPMRERAFAGEVIGGVLLRDPSIGEYSAMPMRFKVLDIESDKILIPETRFNLRASTRISGDIEKEIALGPLVGTAGDKDADTFLALLVSPDNEKMLRKATLEADSEFLQRYTQHQIRYQLLKPKTAINTGNMTVRELMAGDIRKLGTTDQWVPELSLQISEAKRALRMYGKGSEAADAAMLFEWLEQHPISAKHMSAEEVSKGGLSGQLKAISSAMKSRDEAILEKTFNTMVANSAEAQTLMHSSLSIDPSSSEQIKRIMGVNINKLEQVNITKATGAMMNALRRADEGSGRKAELLMGRGRGASIQEMAESVARARVRMSSGTSGAFSNVSRAMGTASNILGAAGRSAIKHHKSIGLGFAASLAVGAMLSSPPDTIGSGADRIPNSNLLMNQQSVANKMEIDDVLPPTDNIGNPTSPNMLANPVTRITGNDTSRLNVFASIPSYINPGYVSHSISSLSGINSSINVNLRDARESINPYAFLNKLS